MAYFTVTVSSQLFGLNHFSTTALMLVRHSANSMLRYENLEDYVLTSDAVVVNYAIAVVNEMVKQRSSYVTL